MLRRGHDAGIRGTGLYGDLSCARTKRESGVKVLGGGCAKCHELEANVKAALASLGLDQSVDLITDFSVIAAYGVMSTPALVVDGKVVSYGKVLKRDEVATILKRERGL